MAEPISNEIREKIVIHKLNKVKQSDIAKWLIISESSVNCGMTRHYGRALSGRRVNDYVPDVRFERTSMMGTLGLHGMVAPMTFKGTLNGDIFRVYVKESLAQALKEVYNKLICYNPMLRKFLDFTQKLKSNIVTAFAV